MELVLNVEARSQTGREARQVRAEGLVPGVVYGQGQQATTLQFKEIDLVRLMRAGGASQLIELQGLGKQSVHALLREVQRHPTRRNILHVDFYQVQMNVALQTEVPVHFAGSSPAIIQGALLNHQLERIQIECLPADIPEGFSVDLGLLKTMDDEIHVSDLAEMPGVRVLHAPDEVIVSLTPPRKLEAEEPAEIAEVVMPERIGEDDEADAE
jgi:large subunit ribosomal protein L25